MASDGSGDQTPEVTPDLFRVAFERAESALLLASRTTRRVIAANLSAAALFGRSADDLRGAELDELLAQADTLLGEAVRTALAEEEASTCVWNLELAAVEGDSRWVDLAISPLSADEAVHEATLLLSLRSCGDRRRSRELQRSIEQRESVGERLRALSELAAGVAHNFNNALTSILAHTQVLVRSEELPDWAHNDLRVIERVSRGAAATVRRIQGFARTRDPNAFEPTDLADVVANAVALTRPRWKPTGKDFSYTLDWIPSEARLPIVGNGAELCEVIVNLIDNGLEAMPEGGRLTISTGLEGERVWVEVRDNGVGIDARTRGRLFDPFFSSKGRQGQGLGLSVSHGIVERHGGEIVVGDASEQPGSRFRVLLPLGEHNAEGGQATLARARPSVILLVDDDPIVRRSLGLMLEQLGHEVVGAEHGRDALVRLDERGDIQLLLTDLAMPVMDGAELLREVSNRFPGLPRVLMTGLVADAEASLVEVADLVLSKPIDLAVMDRVLARFLPAGS